MAKKNFLQVMIDNVRESIQQFTLKQFSRSEKVDRRSVSRGQRITEQLRDQFSDKEVAESLQISRQKYTALRHRIERGEIAGPGINDMLEQTGEKLKEETDRPRDMEGVYKDEAGEEYDIDYQIMGESYIKKNLPWAKDIKPGGFASRQSAINWYGGVTGGKEYFTLAKTKSGRYKIYDIRTPKERSQKGEVSGNLKAYKKISKDRID